MRKEFYREMKVINKYYDVDEENKIVTIPLHFEKATDLVDSSVRDKGDYLISEEVLADISDKVTSIPFLYKVKISLEIDDYEGYDPDKLLDNINDCVELNTYKQTREKKYNRVLAIFLLVIGISLIIINVSAKAAGWYQDIAYEILDIVSWVFIWEATTIAFLTSSELTLNSKKFIYKIIGVELLDKDLNVLASEANFNRYDEWEKASKKERFARALLLFSGAALMASSVLGIIETVSIFKDLATVGKETGAENVMALLVVIGILLVLYTVILLAGVSAITTYLGRGPFRKWSKYVFMVAIALLFAIELFLQISIGSTEAIASKLLTFASALFYLVGIITMIVVNHKEKKEMSMFE